MREVFLLDARLVTPQQLDELERSGASAVVDSEKVYGVKQI